MKTTLTDQTITVRFAPFTANDLSSEGWRSIFGCWRVVDGHLVHLIPAGSEGNSVITASCPDVESFNRWAVAKLQLPGGGFGRVRISLEARLSRHDGASIALDDDAVEWSPYFGMNPVITDLASGSRGHEYHPMSWPDDGDWHRVEIEGDADIITYRFDGQEIFRLPRPEHRPFRQITLESFAGLTLREFVMEGEEPAQRRTKRQETPLHLGALVDFADDLHFATFTVEMLDAMMQKLKDLGVTRVYWMHALRLRPEAWGPEADPQLKARIADWDHRLLNRPEGALTGPATIEACYPFLDHAVKAAHRHGMECFGVMKPFDIPVVTRLGENSPFALEYFYRTHPEAMLQRCPAKATGKGPICSLRIYKDDARPHFLRPEQIVLWTSEDNLTYQKITAPYRVFLGPVVRKLRDHWTGLVQEVRVEAITVEGLRVQSPYLAVVVEGERLASFANRAGHLMEAFDTEGHLVAARRNLQEQPRIADAAWEGQGGFIFQGSTTPRQETGSWRGRDWIELYQHLDGADIGIALQRGTAPFIPGAPDPLHPATQAFWLEWVDEMLAAGVDGIDLRIMNHTNIPDWANYGFGPLAEAAFRQRYGQDLEPEARCRERHTALLGDAYTGFLREASRRVRAAGKKMQHHVSRPMEQRPGQRPMINMKWDWPGWLEEGLLDAITLKDHELAGAFYEEVTQKAAERGLETFHCPYLPCLFDSSPDWAAQMSALLDWEREVGSGGIILYEVACFLRGNEHGQVQLIYPELTGLLK